MIIRSLIIALFEFGMTGSKQTTRSILCIRIYVYTYICILMPIGTAITTATEMWRIYQESLELSTH